MATHSSILAWRISMDRGAWRAMGHGDTKSQTRLSNTLTFFTFAYIYFKIVIILCIKHIYLNARFPVLRILKNLFNS